MVSNIHQSSYRHQDRKMETRQRFAVTALAAACLDRLHAVAAHQCEFGVPGRWLVTGPELVQLTEVVVECGRVQYQHMGGRGGGGAERVRDPTGDQHEAAGGGGT